MQRPDNQPSIVCLLVATSAVTVSLGWMLSAVHQLSREVFAVLLLGTLLPLALHIDKDLQIAANLRRFVSRLGPRSRRALPLLFYLAVLLNLMGGLVHPPNNYDALSYRIPRVLQWLANRGWYWIATANERMNYSGSVQEWLFSPLLAIFRSDRVLFLLNGAAFSLLPFLVFSILTRLSIRPRVAWWWMWLLPFGMGILLQAGGIGNDLLSVFFFLAAMDTALRYRETRTARLLFTSMLAIGLCTGVKLSNFPLVLPWLSLIVPLGRDRLPNGWQLAAVGLLALSTSIIPTVGLNWVQTRSWTGDPQNQYEMNLRNPIAGVLGNLVLISANNLAPPFLPFANDIETALNNAPVFRPESWLGSRFPRFEIVLNELPQEEASGVGVLLVILFLWCLINAPWWGGRAAMAPAARIDRKELVPFVAASGLACLAFMARLGSGSAPRLFLPYTVLIVFVGLLLRDASRVVRSRAWRIGAVASAVMSLMILVVSPARPMFPVAWTLRVMAPIVPAGLLDRATIVYEVYADRADVFAEVRNSLGTNDRVLGLVSSGNDLETSLWRPFGSRRVVHVVPGTTAEELRAMGVGKVLVSQQAMRSMPGSAAEKLSWLASGTVLATYSIRQLARQPNEVFTLVDITPAP